MEERLRPVYEEWASGNLKAGLDLFAPHAVFRVRTGEGLVTADGVAEMNSFMRDFLDTWSGYAVDALEFREHGDAVFVSGRQRGTGTTSGMALDIPVFQVWRFDGDLAVSLLTTPHEDEALREAGLS